MDELKNNEMEKLYAETFQTIQVGALLHGRVIAVKTGNVIVDIGYKSEGYVRREEFTDDEIRMLKPGDAIEVYVEQIRDSEGVMRLSKERASKMKTWDVIEKALRDNAPVEGRITDKTKGGMTVDVDGIKAFLPASQIDMRITRDLDSLIGKKMLFRILKMNSKRSNIIVSRRAILEEERAQKKVETLSRISEGALMKGVVKNITDYGVFVDLGGIDGLLHISDIS